MPEQDQGVSPGSQEQSTGNQGGSDAGNQGGEQSVPVSALQSERSKRQEEQRRREELEQRLSRLEQQGQAQQQQQASNDPLDGLEDDEPLTAGQVRKIREMDQGQQRAMMTEMYIRQNVPDYDDVIKNWLPKKMQENPALQFNPQDPSDIAKAYEIGKAYKDANAGSGNGGGTDQQGGTQQNELEAALEQNQQRPGSGSQAASSSQAPPGEGERVDHAAHQSPTDFDEMIEQAKRGQKAG